MLKFERLGHGSLINDKCRFGALVDEVSDVKVTMKLAGVDPEAGEGDEPAAAPECTFKIRHVGTGTVLEGHRSLVVSEPEAAEGEDAPAPIEIDPAACELKVTATLTRNVPKGKLKLDLSDVFVKTVSDSEDAPTLEADDGSTPTWDENDAKAVLADAAPEGGVEVSVKDFVLAEGAATTHKNAAKVTLKPGKYQVHFITVLHENVEDTHMPNLTMLEFIKHCPDVLPAIHA